MLADDTGPSRAALLTNHLSEFSRYISVANGVTRCSVTSQFVDILHKLSKLTWEDEFIGRWITLKHFEGKECRFNYVFNVITNIFRASVYSQNVTGF